MVSAHRKVGTQQTTVEDIYAQVEPGNPFWVPLWGDIDERTLRKAGMTDGQLSRQEPPAQVAYLAGDVEGVPWECVVQADRVKIGRGKYERGWARIIGLECGYWATATGRGTRSSNRLGRVTDIPQPQDDAGEVLHRITNAANAALDRMEQARRYSQRAYYDYRPDDPDGRDKPDIPVADLPIDEQVLVVARAYNVAVDQGIWGIRPQLVEDTGIPLRTIARRINAAREKGLIPKETK